MLSGILQNLKGKKIVLASQSPRRQELLKGIGLKFEVKVKEDIDEAFSSELHFDEVAEHLAQKKASHYTDIINKDTILITADTIVCTDDSILNKPKDKFEAIEMLNKLSDGKHKVITGVCIKSKNKEESFSSESVVYFEKLTDDEIDYYIDNYKPFDKAGAYGIQEWIGYIGISRLEGSYFNVMGLPVQMVYNKLKKF